MGTVIVIDKIRDQRYNHKPRYLIHSPALHGNNVVMKRGVEKMNSIMDPRESFFKNKVTALMSKPAVIRILNSKPMGKKNEAPIV